jgi:hypothetical protein
MSRELLKKCLDLITELDKDGVVCELGLILELRNALGVPDKLKMKAELAKPEQELKAMHTACIEASMRNAKPEQKTTREKELLAGQIELLRAKRKDKNT